MKYMLLFVNLADEVEGFLKGPESARKEGFARVELRALSATGG